MYQGVVKNLKIQNLIMATHILLLYGIQRQKKRDFFDFEFFQLGGWLPQNFPAPFISEKKSCSDYRVHGIQIDGLNLTVSTQKLVLKNMHPVPRYRPKCVKFCWFGLEGRFWTVFWYYLGTRCIFFKPDFCVETVRLNTMSPIIRTIFFSLIKGSEKF